jgi:hypothetical protein
MPDLLLDPLTPTKLCRARLRLCWDLLQQVGERLDQLPLTARPHVATALAALAQAKAHVEEEPHA